MRQKNLIAFKASDVIASRLEQLCENEGLDTANFLRSLINREYSRFVFGELKGKEE
jgi:hypothetical protein